MDTGGVRCHGNLFFSLDTNAFFYRRLTHVALQVVGLLSPGNVHVRGQASVVMQDGPVRRLRGQVLSLLCVADVQHVQINTEGQSRDRTEAPTHARAALCGDHPGGSSPVLGLRVLVLLLVVAVTLDFGGQRRMGHL